MSSPDHSKAEHCAKLAQSALTEEDHQRWLRMERFWRGKLDSLAPDETAKKKFVL
jgi:hypothetical protein